MKKYSRVCAYVDLDKIRSNMNQINAIIDQKTKIIGVIKTDGYGHGAVPIARELSELDFMYGFATATPEEALILRENGIEKPLLILGYTFPDSYESIVNYNLRPTVFKSDMAKELSKSAVKIGKKVMVHVKVDTGMNRIGIAPNEDGVAFINELKMLPGIEIEGIFTHFARADEKDLTYANNQLEVFNQFCERVEKECGIKIPLRHCSNSAGIIEIPRANQSIVRAGILIYGLWPSEDVSKDKLSLEPALSLKSHIVFIKKIKPGSQVSYGGTFEAKAEMKIATIPVGYGDGYPRSLSNKGYVLIRGKKAPILGKVCMDQFMVDVTSIEDVAEYDEVTLIGKDGDLEITMEELGALSGRFNYELACDLGKRIPRVYSKGNESIID